MAASDAVPAGRPLPGSTPVIGRHAPAKSPQSPGRGRPPLFPPSPSQRSAPSTPRSSSRLNSRLCTASMAFTLKDGARLSLDPAHAGTFTTRQASLNAADRSVAPPYKGFRHCTSTPGVSPRRRQSATGPPGGYPDRTRTGWQRRASNRVRSRHHATPLELQGIPPSLVEQENPTERGELLEEGLDSGMVQNSSTWVTIGPTEPSSTGPSPTT